MKFRVKKERFLKRENQLRILQWSLGTRKEGKWIANVRTISLIFSGRRSFTLEEGTKGTVIRSRGNVINPVYWVGGLRKAFWAITLAGQNRNCPKVLPKCQESKLLGNSTETLMVEELVWVGSHPLTICRRPKQKGRGVHKLSQTKHECIIIYLKFQGRYCKYSFKQGKIFHTQLLLNDYYS